MKLPLVNSFLVTILVLFIRVYQRTLSPILKATGTVCRFQPSCSSYAIQALRIHGVAHGTWLTVRRLMRCNPKYPGGYDPVPE